MARHASGARPAARARGGAAEPRPCAECGRPFVARGRTLTCGAECWLARNRRMTAGASRRWRLAHPELARVRSRESAARRRAAGGPRRPAGGGRRRRSAADHGRHLRLGREYARRLREADREGYNAYHREYQRRLREADPEGYRARKREADRRRRAAARAAAPGRR